MSIKEDSQHLLALCHAASPHGGAAQVEALTGKKFLDFSANLNPLGAPPWLHDVLKNALSKVYTYPDPQCIALKKQASQVLKRPSSQFVFANGAAEIIHILPAALNVARVVVLSPCYADYVRAAQAHNIPYQPILCPLEPVDLLLQKLRNELQPNDLVFIGSPNNPCGRIVPLNKLQDLATEFPQTFFAVDEAFGHFIPNFQSAVQLLLPNVITLVSLTKIFAIAGLRLGFCACVEDIAQKLEQHKPMWSVNALAAEVGWHALTDNEWVLQTQNFLVQERQRLVEHWQRLDISRHQACIHWGTANFFLLESPQALDLYAFLYHHGVLARSCANYLGLNANFLRFAIRKSEDNLKLFQLIHTFFQNNHAKER